MRCRLGLLAPCLVVACTDPPAFPEPAQCPELMCSSGNLDTDADVVSSRDMGLDDDSTTRGPDGTSGGHPSTDDSTDSTGDSTSSSEGETSSTGEPGREMYDPCTDDAECSSGRCIQGFCSSVCWSQLGGDIPCPPVSADAVGVTIVCGVLGMPSCEGCFDCAHYCIALCEPESVCPGDSSCTPDACIPERAYCG